MNSKFKIVPFIIPILILLFAFSCKDVQKTAKRENNLNFSRFEVISLTEQSFIPGVESNIRNSIRYEWELNCYMDINLEFTNLIVDSVKVPISSVIEGEKHRGRNGSFYKGDHPSIHFQAARIIFIKDANYKMVEEFDLESHNYKVPKGHALIEYRIDEDIYTMSMGEIIKKETVFNP